jgi:thiol-disulfide isomerase/thioredoxin
MNTTMVVRTLTGLIVLCLCIIGVMVYKIAFGTSAIVAGETPVSEAPGSAAPPDEALGKFTALGAPRPAPEVTLTAQSGNSVALDSLRGQPVLINFWATWCAPCIAEMPSLVRLQAKLGSLKILAVSEDRQGAAVVDPFVTKNGVEKLAIFLDPKNDVGHAFEVEGLPTSVLIGADGREVATLEGAAQWDSAAMLATLKPYVDGGTAAAER